MKLASRWRAWRHRRRRWSRGESSGAVRCGSRTLAAELIAFILRLEHGSPRINVASGIGMTTGLHYQYQRARTLERVAMYRSGESTIVGTGEPERIQVVRTTPTLASVLRVPPARGRWFTVEEGTPGAPLVAVISHGL